MSGTDSLSIREQAAAWSARMMRSDADEHRDGLEAWLAANEAHRAAYERIMRHYDRAGILAWSGLRKPAGRSWISRWLGTAELAVLGVLGGLGAAGVMIAALSTAIHAIEDLTASSAPERGVEIARTGDQQIATRVGEIRSVALPDGSKVVLDTNARLAVAFSPTARHLTLSSGRARFEVAHEGRPFVVSAGNGEITARGTVFDVDAISRGQVRVTLLRGAIDVGVRAGASAAEKVQRLQVNQQVAFTASGFAAPIGKATAAKVDWPSGVLDVEAMPMSDLLAQANRYAAVPLTSGTSDVGALKVTGRFRIDQPALLARNLADLFDLTINHDQPNRIILERKM